MDLTPLWLLEEMLSFTEEQKQLLRIQTSKSSAGQFRQVKQPVLVGRILLKRSGLWSKLGRREGSRVLDQQIDQRKRKTGETYLLRKIRSQRRRTRNRPRPVLPQAKTPTSGTRRTRPIVSSKGPGCGRLNTNLAPRTIRGSYLFSDQNATRTGPHGRVLTRGPHHTNHLAKYDLTPSRQHRLKGNDRSKEKTRRPSPKNQSHQGGNMTVNRPRDLAFPCNIS